MSFYATIQGQIAYEDKEAFEAAAKLLKDGGWVNEDGNFVDECETVIDMGTLEPLDAKKKVITIPLFCHRNLSRIIDQLFAGGTGEVIWSSTDGCFSGGVVRDGKEEYFGDLRRWARENNVDIEEVAEDAEDFDAVCEYMADVEIEFHASF